MTRGVPHAHRAATATSICVPLLSTRAGRADLNTHFELEGRSWRAAAADYSHSQIWPPQRPARCVARRPHMATQSATPRSRPFVLRPEQGTQPVNRYPRCSASDTRIQRTHSGFSYRPPKQIDSGYAHPSPSCGSIRSVRDQCVRLHTRT